MADRRPNYPGKVRYVVVPQPDDGHSRDRANALWLAEVKAIAKQRGIDLVAACGGTSQSVAERRADLARSRRDAPPRPHQCQTAPELLNCMRQLRHWAGDPSLRVFERRAEDRGLRLPHATLGRALSCANTRLPSLNLFTAFVEVCGAGAFWPEWSQAWSNVILVGSDEELVRGSVGQWSADRS